MGLWFYRKESFTMQMPMCSRCGKNVAVIFITKMDPNNQDSAAQEGLCLKCARQLGIKPLDQMMEQMVPELVHNPMIEYARRMTLAEGISSAPEIRPVYDAVLKALNR